MTSIANARGIHEFANTQVRVGVVFKPNFDFSTSPAVKDMLTLISSVAEVYVTTEDPPIPFHLATIQQMISTCKFIIAVGGDGTMLGLMRETAKADKRRDPMLIGVNMGTVGFITDIELSAGAIAAADAIIGIVKRNECTYEMRDTICIELNGGIVEVAANDILIQRAAGRLLDFAVYFNDRFAYECRADGLLISTPTGSTAYSLAAGGPIIEPAAEVVLVSPLMPQNLSSRPIVLDADTDIKVVLTGNENAKLYLDGNECAQSDRIFRVSRGPIVNFAYHRSEEDRDFTRALRNKLGWNQ